MVEKRSSSIQTLKSRERLPASISVVVPCYNEEDVLDQLRARLTEVLATLGLPYEIIIIDDGSSDSTWPILCRYQQEDSHFRVIRFSRNRGQQIAFTCGLDHATGEVVMIMDADLQDPPELVQEMIAQWKVGYDVVYGKRLEREGEGMLKLLFAHTFYKIFRNVTGFEIPRDAGDFRLLDRRVVKALQSLREKHRFLRGMVPWIGFPQTSVIYKRPARCAGTTKFPFRKSLLLAIDALSSFSYLPLRLITFVGGIVVALSLIGAIIVQFLASPVPGYLTLTMLSILLGGVNLLALGLLGEYVGRTFEQSQRRPLYFIDQIIGDGLPSYESQQIGQVASDWIR